MTNRILRALLVVCGCIVGALAHPSEALTQSHEELERQADELYLRSRQLRHAGNNREAQRLAERLIEIEKITRGKDSASYAAAIEELGIVLDNVGNHTRAEQLHKEALEVRERVLGREHEHVGYSYHNLAAIYRGWAQYAKSDEMRKRALAILEKAKGPNAPEVGVTLNSLAASYKDQGRYADAEAILRRSIAILENAPEKWDRNYADVLVNMASVFKVQGKFDEAEALLKRADAIYEKPQSANRAHLTIPLHNRGRLYNVQGRYGEAEEILKRAIELDRKTYGDRSNKVAEHLRILGETHQLAGNYREAEQAYRRASDMYKRNGETGIVDGIQYDLATVYVAQGQHAKAAPIITKMLPRMQAVYGQDYHGTAELLRNLGLIERAGKRWPEAVARFRESVATWKRIRVIGAGAQTSDAAGENARNAKQSLHDLAEALWYVGMGSLSERGALAVEALAAAQYAAPSTSGTALAQMTVRLAAGDSEIGKLVREAQDLAQQRPAVDKLLAQARGASENQRSDAGIADLQGRLDRINTRLKEIDETLIKRFPEYAELSNPRPLTLADIQGLLRPNEALIAYLAMERETLVWAISRESWDWKRVEFAPEALAKHVAALRCGLDQNAWRDEKSAARCLEALALPRSKIPGENDLLPFDLRQAHELYARLLGPVAELIKGKDLLIVPSGAMAQLPFQVLVKEPPFASATRNPRWPECAVFRNAFWCRVHKEAGWAAGSNALLRAQHVFYSRFGRGDDEDAKTFEAPSFDKASLFAAVEVAELLSPDAGFADEPIGPDVHGAEVHFEGEVVTRVWIGDSEEAVGLQVDRQWLVVVVDGDARCERAIGALSSLREEREQFAMVDKHDRVQCGCVVEVQHRVGNG